MCKKLSALLGLLLLLNMTPPATGLAKDVAIDLPRREPLAVCKCWEASVIDPDNLPKGNLSYSLDDDGIASWQFSGQITAVCTMPWLRSDFDLAEVSFLDTNGEKQSVWVSLGVVMLDGTYFATSLVHDRETVKQTFRPGVSVIVRTRGEHVLSDGIDWSMCNTFSCRIEKLVDPNASISHALLTGNTPRSYPAYGFLFWDVALDNVIPGDSDVIDMPALQYREGHKYGAIYR